MGVGFWVGYQTVPAAGFGNCELGGVETVPHDMARRIATST